METASFGQIVLREARKELGVTEQPPGSNRGPRVCHYHEFDWFSYCGIPWCVIFAWDFIYWHTILSPFLKKGNPYKTAAVVQLDSWARQHGWTRATPLPGCIVNLRFGSSWQSTHTTICEDNSTTLLRCIGGNQSNSVNRRDYRRGDVMSYVMPPRNVLQRLSPVPSAPSKSPRFEIITGEGVDAKVMTTVFGVPAALRAARRNLEKGKWHVRIVRRPKTRQKTN